MRSGMILALLVLVFFLEHEPVGCKDEKAPEARMERTSPDRDWGPEVNGCRIAVEFAEKEYEPCAPVSISIFIENTGKTPLLLYMANAYHDYRLEIKDEDGKPVPLTRFGEMIFGARPAYGAPGPLEAGREERIGFAVNRLYDMTREGVYSITVRRYVVKRDEKGNPVEVESPDKRIKSYDCVEVTSNTITVEVKAK